MLPNPHVHKLQTQTEDALKGLIESHHWSDLNKPTNLLK